LLLDRRTCQQAVKHFAFAPSFCLSPWKII
jgi:hypothetical protein